MQVIDTDPDFLRQAADVTRHAYQQSITHVEAEIKGVIPELMETLTPEGPYGYTILPEVRADGSVGLPIITTREGIQEAYQFIRGLSALLSVTPLTEIRGAWYTFQDNLSRGRIKENGYEGPPHQTLALFPSGAGTGITGELVWIRVPRSRLGGEAALTETAPDGDTLSGALEREKVYRRYCQYLDALRGSDVEAVLSALHDKGASALRDYVNETGTLTTLEGPDAHGAYYQALFEKYDVRSVDVLTLVAEDWYVFAEVRFTVSVRGANQILAFNTAEFYMPADDGRFIARIGHGTDPAPQP
jgi:SnoaL-like domain